MNARAGSFKQARRERDARRGRLGKGVYQRLAGELAATIRLAFEAGATATLWGLEGPLRHAIRADLCLQGWAWATADAMARDLLEDAFRRVNAKRPDWEEGQPEWAIATNIHTERTRCVNCHGPLPEGHWKFCGNLCASNHSRRLNRRREADEERAISLAVTST